MATHSISPWEIQATEEPGELQFMGSQRVRHTEPSTHNNIVISITVKVTTEKRINPESTTEKRINSESAEVTFANLQIRKDLYLDRCPVLFSITFPLRLHTRLGVHGQAGQLTVTISSTQQVVCTEALF